jgi:hypothetical protein
MTDNTIRILAAAAVLTVTVLVFSLKVKIALTDGEQKTNKETESPSKINTDDLKTMFDRYYKPVPVEVKPAVPGYDFPVDLASVANFDEVNAKLKLASCRYLLSKNGFAVIPWESRGRGVSDFQDAYHIINEWKVPVFVTSDSLLHLYHMQFDETLKSIEERVFASDLQLLLEALKSRLLADYGKAGGELKTSLGIALGQTVVAIQLLTDRSNTLSLLKEAHADAAETYYNLKGWNVRWKSATTPQEAIDALIAPPPLPPPSPPPLWYYLTPPDTFKDVDPTLVERIYNATDAGDWARVLASLDEIIARIEKQSQDSPTMKLPGEIRSKVDAELKLIAVHEGPRPSPLFNYEEDYSQYVPRGHYTRSDLLKRYFKTMMYLSRLTYLLKGRQDTPTGVSTIVDTIDARRQTVAATHLSKLLMTSQATDGRTLADIWQRIYDVTAFYVGVSDDLTFHDYADTLAKVIGKDLDASKLLDNKTFSRAKVELAKLHGPAIYSGTGDVELTTLKTMLGRPSPEGLAKVLEMTQGLRVMGQPFVPDSYIIGKLVFPTIGAWNGGKNPPWSLWETGRCFPRSLDVMGVFGSDRAFSLLKQVGDTAYSGYDKTASELRNEFNNLTVPDWNRNLYWSWIWSLKSLVAPVEKGYPSFMQTIGWQDRQIHAASASWSQLRHDTILYAKQIYGGVIGGVEGTSIQQREVPGYVEPSIEFYARLLALARMTTNSLEAMKLLDEVSRQRLVRLDSIIYQLLDISTKELANKGLTAGEYNFIKFFGENLTDTLRDLDSEARDTRIVADVYTDSNSRRCIEEATGPLDWIVVIYRLSNGTLGMGVGPTLSYYEFKQPIDGRLTDKAWQSLLDTEQVAVAGRRPNWTANFLASPVAVKHK